MGAIKYQAYLMEAEKENNKDSTSKSAYSRTPIGYFSLKNDKDSAIVRFMINYMDDIDIINLHKVSVGGRLRSVSCLRDPHDPIDNCPFCASDKKVESKIFIPLIEYVTEGDGQVHAYPKVWEKPARYTTRLANLIEDYGPLSENLFRITRNGAAGDRGTTYTENYLKSDVFPEAIYKKDEKVFNDFHPIGRMVLELTKDEAVDVLNGNTPERLTPRTNNSVASAKTNNSANDSRERAADVATASSITSSYEVPSKEVGSATTVTSNRQYTANGYRQSQPMSRPSEEAVRPRRFY